MRGLSGTLPELLWLVNEFTTPRWGGRPRPVR